MKQVSAAPAAPAASSTLLMFDYQCVPISSRERLLDITYRVRSIQRNVSEGVIQIGNLLIDAQHHFKSTDQMMEWAEAEFGFSTRTLHRYLAVAKKFGEVKLENSLPAQIMYELVSVDTPAELAQQVIEKVKSGEQLDSTEVRRMIDEARREAAEEARAAAQDHEKDLLKELERSKSQLGEMQHQMEGLQTNLLRQQGQMRDLSNELHELKSKPSSDEDRIRQLQAELKELERQKSANNSELAKLTKQADELRAEVAKGRTEKQRQRAQADKLIALRQKMGDLLAWVNEANIIASAVAIGGLPQDVRAELQSIRELMRTHMESLSTLLDKK